IGNSNPRFLFGVNAGLNWKNFDFSMFWQGVGKREIWMQNQAFFGYRGAWTSVVLQSHSMDFWSAENTEAYFARPYLTAENYKNQEVQTRYLQDASYARLKNFQLGYTLPQNVLSKVHVDRLRIYLSGENLL